MSIDELAIRLSHLPGATLGRGPQHPREPDSSIADRVTGFLDTHAALRRDPGYVEFMQKYAGADLSPPDDSLFASILGFAEGVADIEEDMDGPVVDENGFLFFADWGFHAEVDGKLGSHGHSFMFDASGGRRPGIYRYSWTPSANERAWYADDFTTWLEHFAKGGTQWHDLLPSSR
jgi:hypothetical protein